MATAVAGGAAAPGAERGREPGWRRDLAEAAGGEGGRKATRAWAPARAVRLRSCPGPARPRVFRLAPQASATLATPPRGGAGRGRRYPGLDRDSDLGWRPPPPTRPHTRGGAARPAASPGRLGPWSSDAPLSPRCGPGRRLEGRLVPSRLRAERTASAPGARTMSSSLRPGRAGPSHGC